MYISGNSAFTRSIEIESLNILLVRGKMNEDEKKFKFWTNRKNYLQHLGGARNVTIDIM